MKQQQQINNATPLGLTNPNLFPTPFVHNSTMELLFKKAGFKFKNLREYYNNLPVQEDAHEGEDDDDDDEHSGHGSDGSDDARPAKKRLVDNINSVAVNYMKINLSNWVDQNVTSVNIKFRHANYNKTVAC